MNTGHVFTVSQVAFSSETDCFLNIQKKREDIKYKSATSQEVINLAYTQSGSTSSSRNLSIRDRSTVLPENRINTQLADQILDDVSGFTIETDQFLVTDVFTDPIATQIALPLFYVHNLSHTLQVGETIADLKILDTEFRETATSELKVDGSAIYNNLANSFDQDTGLAEIYYISYQIRKTDSTLEQYIEILNNNKVFREAELDDLDEFAQLLPDVKAYIIEQDVGSNFNVILPSLTNYGLRRLSVSRLSVVEPPDTSTEEPWFVSIQNGQFLSSVKTAEPDQRTPYKYYIAEFTNQNFNPYFPFKLQALEDSHRVSKRVIKTVKSNLIEDPTENLYTDVFVYTSSGNIKFALTSDPLKTGTAALGTTLYSNVLLGNARTSGTGINDSSFPVSGSSIDGLGGFIVLPTGYEISETDRVQTSYYYEENRYELSFFDLNPLSNQELVRQRLVIFVKPEELALTITESIFWLLINEDGQVINTNWDVSINGSLGTLDETGLADALADGTLWFDKPEAENPLATRVPSWAPDGSIDFVKNFTVEGDANSYAYLILGEATVREAVRPSSTVINDVRIRGGGINEDYEQTALDIQPESAWYWDLKLWDGYPYPGASSYFIDIPVGLLEECGGRFSPVQVQEIVKRHTAAGVYPVVHKYNVYEPTITNIEYSQEDITVHWTQGPVDVVYQVYTSSREEGPYQEVAGPFANNESGNEATIAVDEDLIKYVVVVGRKGLDGEVCFSGPVRIVDLGEVTTWA